MAVGEIATVVAKTAEVRVKVAETGAKVAETGKKAVDISKRIDITKEMVSTVGDGVDISKRIMPSEKGLIKDAVTKDVSKAITDYLSDLKSISPCMDTLTKSTLSPDKLEVQPSEVVKELRTEWKSKNDKLRSEWEKIHNREWPRYKEDVLNSRDEVIRQAGARFDAHHVQPLKLGGKNEVSNITPLDWTKHSDIHSSTGGKLVDVVAGGKL